MHQLPRLRKGGHFPMTQYSCPYLFFVSVSENVEVIRAEMYADANDQAKNENA
jgi:hypothetical protein